MGELDLPGRLGLSGGLDLPGRLADVGQPTHYRRLTDHDRPGTDDQDFRDFRQNHLPL